jgi:hypothetical protein
VAARNRAGPGSELHAPAITHDRLVLFSRPPEELDLLFARKWIFIFGKNGRSSY